MIFNQEKIIKDFPILKSKKHDELIYLDNAATTQKPKQVIDAEKEFYENSNANIHRGVFALSQKATEKYELARETVAKFIGSKREEIVFTSGATDSLNKLALMLGEDLVLGDEIIISEMEHHSNVLPWQKLAKDKGLILKYIKLNSESDLDLEDYKKLLSEKTKIVSITHSSNVIGTINPIEEIFELAKNKSNAITILDAAQSIAHIKIDVKILNADFLVFSGHKIYGPTGIGVLYGKEDLLNNLTPVILGGGIVTDVTKTSYTLEKSPYKFEAGTPNIAGAIGLAAALDYLDGVSFENLISHEKEIIDLFLEQSKLVSGFKLYGSKINQTSVFSFNIEGRHSHDIASMLDQSGIAVREGYHCAKILLNSLGINSTVRVSFSIYNRKEEVSVFFDELRNAIELLS